MQDNLVDDLLMPTEVTALLGVTTLNQSFWPPLEMFRTSQRRMEPGQQRMVQSSSEEDSGRGYISTLQKQWRTHFRRRGIQEQPTLAMVGTKDHTQSSQDVLLASFLDIWDAYNATDIVCASL